MMFCKKFTKTVDENKNVHRLFNITQQYTFECKMQQYNLIYYMTLLFGSV